MSGFLQQAQNSFIRFKEEAVYQFDVFGQLPNFTVLNRGKFTSSIGFFISLLLEITLLIYLVNEVSSMISYSKPSVFQTEVQVTETSPYYLYNENFTLVVSVANRFSEPLIGQKKYYFLNVSQCIRTRRKDQISGNVTVQLNCTDLPIEPCNMTHFPADAQKDYFSRARFGAMQCINRDYLRFNPPIMQGQFNALMYAYLSITLSVCKNSTDYQGCASQEEIEEALQAGHYIAYYSDFLSKLDSPGQVYEQIINYQFSGFSLSTSKVITQTYRIIETQTDEGLLWEENSFQKNLQFKDWREIQDFYNQQYLITHFVNLDYKQTNNIRTYIKLQTVIARVGGVLQIFILLFATLLRPLITNLMNFQIANSIYRLSDKADLQTCQQIQTLIQTDREQQASPIQLNCVQISQSIPERCIKEIKQQYSLCETFSIILGVNSEKYKRFQKAKKKIQKNLDIVTILKKLQDIDLIKKVIFTKEQQDILKIIPKPAISLEKSINKTTKTPSYNFQDNNSNISPIQLHLRKARQSQFSQNINLPLSKSFIDEQLQNYLDQQHQNHDRKLSNRLVTPEIDMVMDQILESPAQKPK